MKAKKSVISADITRLARAMGQRLNMSPTESMPQRRHVAPKHIEQFQNLYVPDGHRTIESKLVFGGRKDATDLVLKIYARWAELLGAKVISMRPLSGLHSHTLLALAFMGHFEKVLLVSEKHGGHYLTGKIFSDLGYVVHEAIFDNETFEIDTTNTVQLIKSEGIGLVLIDRSETLNYFDYSVFLDAIDVVSIYDASHYLANILVGDYLSPFAMGFDFCIGTMHKSIPGPQKAFVAAKSEDSNWKLIATALATHISSVHPAGIIAAGLVVEDLAFIAHYTRLVMQNVLALSRCLLALGVDVVKSKDDAPPSYFIFIVLENKERAYSFFTDLAEVGIDSNFRLLPFSQGYGIRLGATALTMQGMQPTLAQELAELIAHVRFHGASPSIATRVAKFRARLKRYSIAD